MYKVRNNTGVNGLIVNSVISGVTTTPITKMQRASDIDSESITVDIEYSDAVDAGGVFNFVLQSSNDGANWDFTHATVAVTAKVATRFVATIDLNMKRSGDQSSLPLRPQYRVVVISDNAGNSITIDDIHISSRGRN